MIILPWCTTYIRGSSGYSKKLSTETLITDKFIYPFVSCLLSHPSSFGSFSRSIYFLRKQHYLHPFNKLPVLCLNRLWRWATSSDLWSDGHSLFEWITTVIKFKLITRNRLWNAGAVTQESLQNSSLGKSLYLLEWKKNKSTVRFFGVCAFVLSATDLMKSSSDNVLHNHL